MPGVRTGDTSTRALRHQYATMIPPAAATAERHKPSVKSCLIKRRRPAPSARRIVISWRRRNERASKRLLTFAQAIKRTKNATPLVIASVDDRFPTALNGVFHKGKS